MDATPIPNPPINLKTMRVVNDPDNIQPTADARNNMADRIRTIFRPYLSLSLPEKLTPMIQPSKAQLTNQPSLTGLRLKSVFTRLMVPEITAVSKPNKKPPNAATRHTKYRYTLLFFAIFELFIATLMMLILKML
jgi:hypothetical protein